MHLKAFQSDKGDCLLLESKDRKHRVLIDGGIRRAYSEHVAPALAELRDKGKDIDAVYISHIDDDHIAGVLQLLDDEAAWRVHEHQLENGNPRHKPPKAARPAEVKQIWHNAFHDQVRENAGPIEDLLAATATVLLGSSIPELRQEGFLRKDLATSIQQALQVSSRIRDGQLNIPLNRQFEGKLMMVDQGGPGTIPIGSMKLQVIGPFSADLDKLRSDWNKWLKQHGEIVKRLRERARSDADDLSSSVDALFSSLENRAAMLAEMELAMRELGNRKKVTPPNLASLMFFVKEGDQTILLTGDGHWQDILNGLEHHSLLKNGKIHVDVLKAQHHGSENNFHEDFCKAVIADRYVFCGNGQHENPDLDVLELVVEQRKLASQKPFQVFFNSSSKASIDEGGRAHMKKVEKLMKKLETDSDGKLTTEFITTESSIDIV
jgi:beta-lactamase superfamily II metal-dependent hydrolase